MQRVSVTKCQGTGNDFLLIDARGQAPRAYAPLAHFLCDRHFGVGADGLLVLSDATQPAADVQMQIFNADGSEAEMCGNGVRCIARYALAHDGQARLRVQTVAGVVETAIASLSGETTVSVAMGVPQLLPFPNGALERQLVLGEELGVAFSVSMGNPHVVIFTHGSPESVALREVAEHVAGWQGLAMQPNIEIANLKNGEALIRILERGVGETLSCGTGACAVAASAIAYRGARSPLAVRSKGGSVTIEWAGPGKQATLSGPAEIVFEAEIDLPETVANAAAAV